VKLLVDEDPARATLLVRLRAAGHELGHVPAGTPDEIVFRKR
jgi:hypothetical protein